MKQIFKLKIISILALATLAQLATKGQGRIIMNGASMKIINSAYVSTSDLTIINGGSVIVDSSTIKIARNISNAGIFNLANGTLEMNGAVAQTIPANSITNNTLKNLIASNNFNLAGQDSITGVLSFGASNKTVSTGGLLTLKSTAAATARVADITNEGTTSGNSITGNVHIERYISPVRAWRLLTAPISPVGAQTINTAWQEGVANPTITYASNQNPVPGFGVHIPGGATNLGFDKGINANTSLKVYNPATGAWTGITATNRPITDSAGYMLFFRGNRSTNLSQGLYAAVTSSVLRSTGQLKTNNQTTNIAATGFTLIGNPYASSIDLHQITRNNVPDIYYVWDPKITGTSGVGGFVTITWDGDEYDTAPTGTGTIPYIQSGSAFFATSLDNATPGTIIIKETDKSVESINANRGAGTLKAKLKTNFYSMNADGTKSLVDGILNSYADMYSNSIDEYDAPKLTNFSESLSSQREGKLLAAERRQPLNSADTIFLNMLQMRVKTYQFKFSAENFAINGLTGYLEDSYFNTSTSLDLQGTTVFNFDVINVPGSWNPARFRIVFKQATILPLTLTNVRAFPQKDDIKVEWKVENEIDIKQYDIERSGDGRLFVKANAITAAGSANYNWLDEAAMNGNNYYRIKSIGINGEVRYSSVVKVYMDKDKPAILLLTNIITANVIKFQMNNMPKGTYAVSITNNLGQLMLSEKITREKGTSTENIQLGKNNFATGIYHLNILKPDLTSFTAKLLLQ